mmetsp:Transcript_21024/g.31187  ORF Transcript_21024/g.31187 Transcript_21024/m.31187 type:complete len:83 (-) Transcript_21024:579-827(-)
MPTTTTRFQPALTLKWLADSISGSSGRLYMAKKIGVDGHVCCGGGLVWEATSERNSKSILGVSKKKCKGTLANTRSCPTLVD